MSTNPMHPSTARMQKHDVSRLGRANRCLASTRTGTPCQSPAVRGKRRCRMHGGALGSGAPTGVRNGAYKHGESSKEQRAKRRLILELIRAMKSLS